MSAIILDTETTGVDAPEVIELAFSALMATPREYAGLDDGARFKPSKPIALGAMATHHIIPDDLVNCPPWPGSWTPPPGVDYIIGHNIDFDWRAIGEPKIKRICTLALARKAWLSVDSHSLGALIYHLYPPAMARDLLRNAHDAGVDVNLCARVLAALVDIFYPRDWAHLWEISEQARVPTHFTFGKYGPKDGAKQGVPITEVRKIDPGYIRWCLSSCDIVTSDPYWHKALTA